MLGPASGMSPSHTKITLACERRGSFARYPLLPSVLGGSERDPAVTGTPRHPPGHSCRTGDVRLQPTVVRAVAISRGGSAFSDAMSIAKRYFTSDLSNRSYASFTF